MSSVAIAPRSPRRFVTESDLPLVLSAEELCPTGLLIDGHFVVAAEVRTRPVLRLRAPGSDGPSASLALP